MKDDAFTSLPGRPRLAKSDDRLCALGSLDELQAALGLLRAALAGTEDADRIETIQRNLLHLGGELAAGRPQLPADSLDELDRETARLQESLPPLHEFILPGTNEPSARAHAARAVCRRAERDWVRMQETLPGEAFPIAIPYLNRLSRFLFALARTLAP